MPLVSTPQVEAAARSAMSAITAPAGAHLARMRDRRAQALDAAVGMDDRALLLGVGLGGEDDVGVLAQAVGEDGGVGHDQTGARAEPAPTGARSGRSRTRIGLEQVKRGDLAVGDRLRDPRRVAAGAPAARRTRGRRWAPRRPRAARGRWRRRGSRAARRPRGRPGRATRRCAAAARQPRGRSARPTRSRRPRRRRAAAGRAPNPRSPARSSASSARNRASSPGA